MAVCTQNTNKECSTVLKGKRSIKKEGLTINNVLKMPEKPAVGQDFILKMQALSTRVW